MTKMTKMTNKIKRYVCPKCQSTTRLWEEYCFLKIREIDPRIGKLIKSVEYTKPDMISGNWGVECSSGQCDWFINLCHTDIDDYYNPNYHFQIEEFHIVNPNIKITN